MLRLLASSLMLFSVAVAFAEESIPGVDSHYRNLQLDNGVALSAIVTRPTGERRPLKPLLFTQWVSCGSIEYREGSNARELLAALARDSGLALVRVERDAVDDSGPACADLDYDTEFAHYLEAFRQLLDDPLIDDSAIYVYGSSLGSTMAPLVAEALQSQGYEIAGVVVQGGGAVTYLERMLNFDRINLERRPDEIQPADIHAVWLDRARFQFEYLVEGRHPDAIARDSAAMAEVRSNILGLGENDHYGRPFAWHQQAAQRNFLEAWAALEAKVLVVFNEYDQFETRHGHKLIADTANRLRPGSARFVERASIGHSDNRYASVEDAYAFRDGEPAWREAAEIMLEWLRTAGD